MENDVTPELLGELISYNPETGALTWKRRDRKWFKADREFNRWNNRYAGSPALSSPHKDGYLCGAVFKKPLLAHRVAWAIYHGEWPTDRIDHRNQDGADNRICNLRDVDHYTNMRNRKLSANNKSGVNGVSWHKSTQKWVAQIGIDGKRINLGVFSEFSDAVSARKRAEDGNGFTSQHGGHAQ